MNRDLNTPESGARDTAAGGGGPGTVTGGAGPDPVLLDGHTLEELADYLAAGRTPRNAAIEASPGCQHALDALLRLRGFTAELWASDTAAEPPADESWVRAILAGIARDARAGRRIPIATADPHADLGITEGAVRGLIRAAESALPGVIIGRCQLDGEITETGAPVRVRVDASVSYGVPMRAIAEQLRAEIAARLQRHTELVVTRIDIRIRDVQWHAAHAREDRS